MALAEAPIVLEAQERLERFGVQLKNGMLSIESSELAQHAALLKSLLNGLSEVARYLSVSEPELAELLSRLVSESADSRARMGCLTVLQEHLGQPGAARAASLKALGDPDPEIRLLAAIFLGDWEPAAGVAGLNSARDTLRLRALGYVIEAAPRQKTLAVLGALLKDRSKEIALAALRAFKKLGSEPPAENLRPLSSGDRESTVAAIDALRDIGSSSAEAILISLLDRRDETVQIAAMRALGSCGTAAAVEPLLKHA
jgi:HEAT repeat protein